MVTKPDKDRGNTLRPRDSSAPISRRSGRAPKGTTPVLGPEARPRSFRDAYLLTAEHRAAILPTDLISPGPIDVTYAVSTALSSAVRLDQRRDKIAARFPEELVEIDNIDPYARAVAHAANVVNATLAPIPHLQEVYEAGLAARRLLLSDVNNAVNQALVSPETRARLSGDSGYINVANDILAAVQVFSHGGSEILDKIATPAEKLTEYEHLAYDLVELASRRAPNTVSAEEAREDLQRALTLLIRAYYTAERVMAFFELKDDAYRKVVPSLYGGPKASKSLTAVLFDADDTRDQPFDNDQSEPITERIEAIAQNSTDTTETSIVGLRAGSLFPPVTKG